MAVLAWETIAGLAYEVGLRGEQAAIAVAITQPESGRDFAKHNDDVSTGDDSWGGWQINMLGGLGPDRRARYGLAANTDLLNPVTNAKVMYGESGGGADFSPWTTFNHGKHTPFLEEARAAVRAVEARGGNPPGWWTHLTDGSATATDSGSAGAVKAPPVRTEDILSGLPAAIDPDITRPRSADWTPGFFIRGQSALRTLVADLMFSGTMDLGTEDVAEMTIEVGSHYSVNPYPIVETLGLGTPVDWWDLLFVVAGIGWGEGPGMTLQFTAQCRAAGPEQMRKRTGNIERRWQNMSPTEVVATRCDEAGLRFVGEGSNRRDSIVRKGPPDGAVQMPTSKSSDTESDWDLAQRLAKEEGYWFFETAGCGYFARPSWLAWHMPHFAVDAPPMGNLRAADDVEKTNTGTVGVPDAQQAIDDDLLPGIPPRQITCRIPRDRGEQVRPGMVADFHGLPLFDGVYLVQKVSWPLDGGLEPATLTLVDAKDPVPDPPADDGSGSAEGDGSPPPPTDSTATPVGTGGGSALDMVTVALRQVGDEYVYGAETDPNDPDPSAFDCSELVQWACARVGVTFVDGSYAQLAACERISVESASKIRGALLFPLPDAHHVAISLGDGSHTVEAMGRKYGVVQGDIGTRFGTGGLIPGLDYDTAKPIDPRGGPQ